MTPPRKSQGRPRTLDRVAALDAAMRLFWERGYEGTSVADLARAMKMTPPSIYEAFGDKEALYRKALDRYQADRAAAMAPILAGASVEEAVLAIIVRAVEQATRPGDPTGCLVSGAPGAGSPRNLAALRAGAAAREQFVAQLRDRLARGIEAGAVDPRVDAAAVARFAAAVLQGISTQARDGIPRAALDAVAALAAAAVRQALHPAADPPG